MKVCTKCGDEKPFEEFHKDKAGRDGHRPECKPCKRKLDQAWNQRTAKQRAKVKKKYRQENKEKIRAYNNEYRKKNPEKVREIKKRERIKNAERYREYEKRTRPQHAAREAKRRAKKLKATPSWADITGIELFYMMCPEGYHVDHIVPLQGKNVSGLHCLANLQYLPAQENLRKYNKFNGTV